MDPYSLLASPGTDDRFFGVTIGIVTNNKDPDGLGRVKTSLPWMADQVESDWARVVTPMAGSGRGVYFLPEVNDEVLVAFEHGNPGTPYVLGGLWNGKDKPPESNSDGQNNRRTIKSRSGHTVCLDDTDGAEQIVIVDKTGKNRVVIDSSENSLTLEAFGDITVKATGNLNLSGNEVKIEALTNASFKANANLDVNANAQLTFKGAMLNLN